MKTTQELDEKVSRWHAAAEPPASLRVRVLNAADIAPSVPVVPAPSRRRVLWAAGAMVTTACVSALVFAAISTPTLPAFAQVVEASTDVQTVQYDEETSQYDARTKKVLCQTSEIRARLDLPATRRDAREWMSIDTAEWHLWRAIDNKGKWRTVRKPEPRHSEMADLYKNDPATRLRSRIEGDITPPKLTGADNPNLSTVMEVTEFGRPLLRYDAQTGRKFHGPGKLTTTCYRETVWADPRTRRAVRTRIEYYDGEHHSVITKSNFRYDESLDDALFDTSRPQETLVK